MASAASSLPMSDAGISDESTVDVCWTSLWTSKMHSDPALRAALVQAGFFMLSWPCCWCGKVGMTRRRQGDDLTGPCSAIVCLWWRQWKKRGHRSVGHRTRPARRRGAGILLKGNPVAGLVCLGLRFRLGRSPCRGCGARGRRELDHSPHRATGLCPYQAGKEPLRGLGFIRRCICRFNGHFLRRALPARLVVRDHRASGLSPKDKNTCCVPCSDRRELPISRTCAKR